MMQRLALLVVTLIVASSMTSLHAIVTPPPAKPMARVFDCKGRICDWPGKCEKDDLKWDGCCHFCPEPNPGRCPDPEDLAVPYGVRCLDSCSSDEECGEYSKCCKALCGSGSWRCVRIDRPNTVEHFIAGGKEYNNGFADVNDKD